MASARYTHVSIQADDLDESVRFYEEVFGMPQIPTPNFEEAVQWLGCGDLQLHIVETDAEAPLFNHHALHVDDFERVYRALWTHDGAEFEALGDPDEHFEGDAPPVYVMPNGSVQLYFRDPAGNLVEVDYPVADEVVESVVTNLRARDDVAPHSGDGPEPVLYGEALLEAVGRGRAAAED